MSNTTWIVLANAARARIFEARAGSRPTEVDARVHPGSRMKADALTLDQKGRSERQVGDGGRGGSAYEPPLDPREKEHRLFARELAQALDEAVGARRCDALLLVASPAFLGEVRAALGEAAGRAVRASVAKDLTELPTLDLQHRLAELLAEAGGPPASS